MRWNQDIESPWRSGDALPPHNDACMVCGETAAASPLLAPFRVRDEGRVGTCVRFDDRHQGAPHFAHGGIVAAVLDDACGYVSFVVTRMFVTAHLEVDYRRPVVLGTEYEVEAWCEGIDGRKVSLRAELRDRNTVIAEAQGLFVTVDVEHFRP